MAADLSQKVEPELAYMMHLACDFSNLVYRARVRYNVMLSEGENVIALSRWEQLEMQCSSYAAVDLKAVFEKLRLQNPATLLFLMKLQEAFVNQDIDMVDQLIKKREIQLKGVKRAKLNRPKEFDPSVWVGGEELDYRFSDTKRIINDIYAGEVSADV